MTLTKSTFLFLGFLLTISISNAQSPARITIKGSVVDSSKTTLPSASVMLLLPKDSSLVNFNRTDNNGNFEFKNLKRQAMLLKVSYVGYLPYQQEIDFKNSENVLDLGKIELKPIQKELLEVVIRTAKAPLSIRGDTVEYNASSFKVPPGSSVEDLLRRLPGIQVSSNGDIKAQGQDVKKVTVDGKSFFGNDPKLATKNLPADAIQKVQVFNDKTEQAKITGVDDGKKEKTINLELKEDHKKGGFGKITAGAGTNDRLNLKGNYNKFDPKRQFAVIGLGNNTNQTGMSWDDYQDFKGSQSFNFGDEADFGFNGGRRFYFFNDDGESITVQPSWGAAQGFAKNYAGGLNYNFDTKKTKFSSNYYYNKNETTLNQLTNQETFIDNATSYKSVANNFNINTTENHRFGLRFEKSLDSLNTLIVLGNGLISKGNINYGNLQQFYQQPNVLSNEATIHNLTNAHSFKMSTSAIFRHKFKTKGRNFAWSMGYNLSDSDGSIDLNSINKFYQATNVNDQIKALYQLNSTTSNRALLKSSLLYVEPLSKKIFLETFYNFSLRNDAIDRNIFDKNTDGNKRNDALSRYYTNEFMYNRVGTSLRYTFNGINIAAGLAGQQFDLAGQFAGEKSATTFTKIDKNYFTWLPNVSVNLDLKNNHWLYAGYNVNTQEPSIKDLQPIVDATNPLFIKEGNPDLLPSKIQEVNAGGGFFNPASFTNVNFNIGYTYNQNQVVYNQRITKDPITNAIITYTKPENLSGGNGINSYFGFGFPLKKTKSTLNISSTINLGTNPTYINQILNDTKTNNYNIFLRLDLTPSEAFTFYGNARLGFSNTQYSINTAQNQEIMNHSVGGEMNVNFLKTWYFNSAFNYSIYRNDRFGFDQKIPIWNASIYKIIGKAKKAEVRLSAYDMLNRNIGISQSASSNIVMTQQTQTLSRYFMLSFTYNMRGVNTNLKKRNNW